MRKVRSKTEAEELFDKYMEWLVHYARCVAVEMATQGDGSTDAPRVREVLLSEGALERSKPDEAELRFMGSVFSGARSRDHRRVFVPTGRKTPRHSAERNTHKGGDGDIVWRLADGADFSDYKHRPNIADRPKVPLRPRKAPAVTFDRQAAARDLHATLNGASPTGPLAELLAWLESP